MPSWLPGSDCRKCLRREAWSRLTLPRPAANGAVTPRVVASDLFRTYRPQTSVRLTRWVMTQAASSSARAPHSPATRSMWFTGLPPGKVSLHNLPEWSDRPQELGLTKRAGRRADGRVVGGARGGVRGRRAQSGGAEQRAVG